MQLDGPELEPLSGGKAGYLIVLLHGVAAMATTPLILPTLGGSVCRRQSSSHPMPRFPTIMRRRAGNGSGFSQGAATALYAGLHRQKRIAGVAAFSGALSGAAHLLGEIASKPPMLLVHGEEDNVVPFQSMANAQTALEAAGVKVRAVARPGLGHAIDGAGIALAGDFLREVLASGRAAAGTPA
jgi:hypothetical protein